MLSNSEKFEHFLEAFRVCCRLIDEKYFLLPQHHKDTVYRERVYAYELYHQLREMLKKHKLLNHLSINGEVDKSGRPDFNGEKPDLILHYPGNMDENIAVIEIKTARGSDFKNANRNLQKFTTEYKYVGGILLTFGDMDESRLLSEIDNTFHDRCHYLLQQHPKREPKNIYPK